jgi:hypothetical protein
MKYKDYRAFAHAVVTLQWWTAWAKARRAHRQWRSLATRLCPPYVAFAAKRLPRRLYTLRALPSKILCLSSAVSQLTWSM